MNRFKLMIFALAAIMFSVSCGKKDPVVEYLDVTPNNIAGEWKLVEWEGTSLDDGTYMYVEFVRKDREFTIYQNFDSMGDMPHIVTGTFNIETDVELGAIIRGLYDYDEGVWAHDYEVNELTKDSMTWIAVDDPDFVQKWVRCSVPEEFKK